MNRRERRKAGFKGVQEPLEIKMQNKGDQVVIEFNANIRWFAMNVHDAEEFNAKLQKHIDKLRVDAISAERSD